MQKIIIIITCKLLHGIHLQFNRNGLSMDITAIVIQSHIDQSYFLVLTLFHYAAHIYARIDTQHFLVIFFKKKNYFIQISDSTDLSSLQLKAFTLLITSCVSFMLPTLCITSIVNQIINNQKEMKYIFYTFFLQKFETNKLKDFFIAHLAGLLRVYCRVFSASFIEAIHNTVFFVTTFLTT